MPIRKVSTILCYSYQKETIGGYNMEDITLTELGYSLKPVLDAMWNWGEEYKAKQ